MNAIAKMPLLDYFEILNTKQLQAKKAKEERDKQERDRRIKQAKK